MAVVGILLAAGAGLRAGGPKALRRGDDGVPWVQLGVAALVAGGCEPVLVVIGAAADQVLPLVPAEVDTVQVPPGRTGMGVSLAAALTVATGTSAQAALITLVDTPGMTSTAVSRLAALAAPSALARAAYHDEPGHPVLIGRDHWAPLLAVLSGETGARDYLESRGTLLVECSDVADGTDFDTPP